MFFTFNPNKKYEQWAWSEISVTEPKRTLNFDKTFGVDVHSFDGKQVFPLRKIKVNGSEFNIHGEKWMDKYARKPAIQFDTSHLISKSERLAEAEPVVTTEEIKNPILLLAENKPVHTQTREEKMDASNKEAALTSTHRGIREWTNP
jgi:hypothetical protein